MHYDINYRVFVGKTDFGTVCSKKSSHARQFQSRERDETVDNERVFEGLPHTEKSCVRLGGRNMTSVVSRCGWRCCARFLFLVSGLMLSANVVGQATGAAFAVSSNTIVLYSPCREQVSVESARLDHFSSEKVGLSFVIR